MELERSRALPLHVVASSASTKDDAHKYVYLLQSIAYPDKRYVGLTGDLEKRLADHNSGRSPHTSRYMPWKVVVSVRFVDDDRAVRFERYL